MSKIQSMDITQLKKERIRLEGVWDDYFDRNGDEGHSGSPGEWIAEALNEVETRLNKLQGKST